MLAQHFVRAGEVGNDLSPCQSHAVGGCSGHPKVFAYLNAQRSALEVEEQVFAEADTLLCAFAFAVGHRELHPTAVGHFGSRGKPSGLVELVVVGQIYLGHNADDDAVAQQDGAVVEPVAVGEGCTHGHGHVNAFGRFGQVHQSRYRSFQQCFVVEEVGACISCQGEFWENQQLHSLRMCFSDEVDVLFQVVFDIGHPHGWNGSGDTEEPIIGILFFHIFLNNLRKDTKIK